MVRSAKIAIFVVLLISALMLFLAIFIQTPFVKGRIAGFIESYLENQYGVRSDIVRFNFDVFPLKIWLENVRIYGGEKNDKIFLQARRLEVSLPHSSIWSKSTVISRILLVEPEINPENLPKFKEQKKTEPSSERTFEIREIAIKDGSLKYARMQIEEFLIDATAKTDRLEIKKIWAKLNGGELNARGVLNNFEDPQYRLEYQASASAALLADIIKDAPEIDGSLKTSGTVIGETGGYSVDGKLEANGISIRNSTPFQLGGKYGIRTEESSRSYTADLEWEGVSLKILQQFAPSAPQIASMSRGSLKYSGPQDFWQGSGEFETVLSPAKGAGLPLSGTVAGVLADQALALRRTRLSVFSSTFDLAGSIRERTLDVNIDGHVPSLAQLTAVSPQLKDIPGSYSIEANLSGPLKNITARGNLKGAANGMNLTASGSYSTGSGQFQAVFQGLLASPALQRISNQPELRGEFRFSGNASGTTDAPRLQAHIEGRNVQYDTFQVGPLTARLQSNGRVLSATASIPQYSGDVNASYRFQNKSYQLKASFTDLQLAQLQTFSPQIKEVSGEISATVEASGNTRQIRNSIATVVIHEGYMQREDVSARIESGSVVRMANQRVRLDLNAVLSDGSMHVTGQIVLNRIPRLDLRVAGNTDLRMASLFMKEFEASGPVQVDVSITGTTRTPHFAGTFRAPQFSAYWPERRIRFDQASATGDFAGKQADIRVAGMLNGSPIRAEGTVPLTKDGAINVDVDGSMDLKTVALFNPNFQGNGNVQLDVHLAGTMSRPQVTGHVSSNDLTVSWPERNLTFLNGRVDARFQGSSAIVQAGGSLNGSPIQVAGLVPLRQGQPMDLDVTGTIDMGVVSKFYPPVQGKGTIDIDLDIGGTFAQPDYAGSISSQNVAVHWREKNLTFQATQLQADFSEQQADITAAGELNGSTLRAVGTVPLSKTGAIDMRVTGQADLALLQQFREDFQATGIVELDVAITGNLPRPDYEGHVSSEAFTFAWPERQLQLTQGVLDADFSEERLAARLNGLINGSPLLVEAGIPLASRPGNIRVVLDSFPVKSLLPEANINGSLRVTADALGYGRELKNWSGDVMIEPIDVTVAGQPLQTPQPITVALDEGVADLSPLQMQIPELLDLRADGRVNLATGSIDASVIANMGLALVQHLRADYQVSGRLSAEFEIKGRLADPDMAGVVRVNEGFFRMQAYPFLLEDVRLVAPIQNDSIRIETFEAMMGGGTLKAGGTIDLEGWSPQNIDVRLSGERVGINYAREDIRAQLNLDLRFTSREEDYLLSGDVELLRSIYRGDIDPRQRLINTLLAEKQALTTHRASETNLFLDVNIRSIDDIRVRNNLARIRATAEMQVQGTMERPRLSGRVRIREGGKLYFEGNQFEFQRGIVDFYGTRRIEPHFDIELFTIVQDVETREDYEITFPLAGSTTDLEDTEPSSYPPLSPNQIYFLLLTGRADAQLTRASARFFQRQFASYLSGQVFSDAQRKLAGAFGLSRVELQPEFVSSETDPGAKLILGKDFTSSLSLIYSTPLTDSGEQTWIASYRPKRNLSIRFIDQEEGSYTTSIRHSVRFGQGLSRGDFRERRGVDRLPEVEVKHVEIRNSSPLNETEIRVLVELEPGDDYDFWEAQDQIDKLKEELQNRGYLFPSVEMREKPAGRRFVTLEIDVQPSVKREMIFHGYPVDEKLKEKYRFWWREGFSDVAVVAMIRNDLVTHLRENGHHQASVAQKTEKTDDLIRHYFEVHPGTKFEKVNLTLQGAKSYPADDLLDDLRSVYESREEMNVAALHDFENLRDKIVALYLPRGYLITEAEEGATNYQPKTRTISKEIIIQEGPKSAISEVEIAGASFPSELRRQLQLRKGTVYDPRILNTDELAISDYYEKKGYREFDMESSIDFQPGTNNLTLQYRVQTGPVAKIDSIQIRGNNVTKSETIRKQLKFREGDILTSGKLAEAQKNLYDLRLFHLITIEAEETSMPGRYDIRIDVVEMKKYEFTYGGRYDTESGIEGEVQVQDHNILGTGHSISLYSRVSRHNQLHRAVYHSPTVLGLQWKTLLSASFEDAELPFPATRWNFTAQRQYEMFRNFIFLASYNFERVETAQIIPLVPTNADISRLIGTLFKDTRDDPLNATKGLFSSFEFEWAPAFLGSDIVFIRTYNQYFTYRQVWRPGVIWASGLRLGLARAFRSQNLIATERFFAGGSFSLRGFERDQLGPNDPVTGLPIGGQAVVIINQELRFPIFKWFGGAVFYDVGNLYQSVRNIDFGLRHSVGAGLRVNTPFGIGRIDLGVNLDPRDDEQRYVIHFGLGQAF